MSKRFIIAYKSFCLKGDCQESFACAGAMQMTMEAELQREVTRRQYEQRKGVIQSALNSSLENDKAIEAVLYTKVILPFERDK